MFHIKNTMSLPYQNDNDIKRRNWPCKHGNACHDFSFCLHLCHEKISHIFYLSSYCNHRDAPTSQYR